MQHGEQIMRKPVVVLGVPIDTLTMDGALDRLDEFVAVGRATGRSHQIATVNVDFVVNSLRDPELRWILQEADMATPDGMPLVWGTRMLGVSIAGRVTGVDMVPALAARAAARGYSIFFLGGQPGVAERAVAILQQRHPNLKVAGILAPPSISLLEDDSAIVNSIRAARPDILLVAFGNPKQEKWINMHADALQIPVCMGIGGALDMIVGIRRRAPEWMQRAGLEWSFRLIQEPRRLCKRYAHDLCYFGYYFLRQYWALRHTIDTPLRPASCCETGRKDIAVIRLFGRIDITNQADIADQAEQALAHTPFLAFDLAEATSLDSAALGCLVTLANCARASGGCLWLVGVPRGIARLISLLRLDRFFETCPTVDALVEQHRDWASRLSAAESYVAGWLIAAMPRRLDAVAAQAILSRYRRMLIECPRLVLDLSKTIFLSSAGVAEIIQISRQAKDLGGELRAAGCSRDIVRCMRLLKADRMVSIFPTVEAALADSAPELGAASMISVSRPLAHE
jgi:N-acetylglucosaminyldiphosphoundecaprenol N-acetyl-beta-D-mannosaminyltransferase